ncbi:helix-turn-helix domain-containing protein [Natronobacterium texcoconense]|uniref:HTH DNA binding domain-containing protein n=1 Tax=Natronobacterium texcoconense TaxID=1095778 RepID=A0A1H1HJW9_NATTX|nr:helix-turn-helix domain-containing protein [Natronobacterium texcoconense]SDR25810.1 HTH DNA binding domain-containing protein [Natronobacterium texcoconense]
MPYIELTITMPTDAWLGRLSREYPDLRFRVLAATVTDGVGAVRLEIIGSNAQAVCDKLETLESVPTHTVQESAHHRRRVQLETTTPHVLGAIQSAGVPLSMPFEISDSRMTLETTLPQDQLSDLVDSFDASDIQYRLHRIQPEADSDSLLTDRQRWILHEAIDRGYYDTPRRITLVELAEELDIAKSTCSETLHRVEERVLKQFVTGDCEHQPDICIRAD